MGHIVLVGFMGTGKTSVGRKVAAALGRDFVDTDAEVERVAKMTISQIFSHYGERRFRQEEALAIQRAVSGPPKVIATGGGAVLDPANVARLKETGVIVCLSARSDIIRQRVLRKRDRPLLADDDSVQRIEEMLAARRPAYQAADFLVDTSELTVDEVARQVLELADARVEGEGGVGRCR